VSTGTGGLNAAWGMYETPCAADDGRGPAPSRRHVWMDVCSSTPGKTKPKGCRKGWWTTRGINDPLRYFCPVCAALEPFNSDGWRPGPVAAAYDPERDSERRRAERRAKVAASRVAAMNTAERREERRLLDEARARDAAKREADRLEAIRLRRDGATILAIAGKVRRGKVTIMRWLKAAGVTRRGNNGGRKPAQRKVER
jgi:hypothetical protein